MAFNNCQKCNNEYLWNNDIHKTLTLCHLVKLNNTCKIGLGKPCAFLKQQKFILTAVTKPTSRRLFQLVDVKSSAVFHSDVVLPVTAAAWPVITNLASHYTFRHGRMISIEPSWSMRTTAILQWAWGWHLVTSTSSEAIPTWVDIILVTF